MGRAPRRFAISRILREPLVGITPQGIAAAFAEEPRRFQPPSGRPNLRLVSSRD
jgi:hypothetical protein